MCVFNIFNLLNLEEEKKWQIINIIIILILLAGAYKWLDLNLMIQSKVKYQWIRIFQHHKCA